MQVVAAGQPTALPDLGMGNALQLTRELGRQLTYDGGLERLSCVDLLRYIINAKVPALVDWFAYYVTTGMGAPLLTEIRAFRIKAMTSDRIRVIIGADMQVPAVARVGDGPYEGELIRIELIPLAAERTQVAVYPQKEAALDPVVDLLDAMSKAWPEMRDQALWQLDQVTLKCETPVGATVVSEDTKPDLLDQIPDCQPRDDESHPWDVIPDSKSREMVKMWCQGIATRVIAEHFGIKFKTALNRLSYAFCMV